MALYEVLIFSLSLSLSLGLHGLFKFAIYHLYLFLRYYETSVNFCQTRLHQMSEDRILQERTFAKVLRTKLNKITNGLFHYFRIITFCGVRIFQAL